MRSSEPSVVGARRALLLAVTLAAAVASLSLSGFRFKDDDSILYGHIAAGLVDQPVSSWIEPHWPPARPRGYQAAMPGNWKTGPFEEHMAVFFWLPALVGKMGAGPELAILAANLVYILLILLLIYALVRERYGEPAAHLATWTWVFSQAGLTYLVRGNHEPALAVGVLGAILGMVRLPRHVGWGALMVASVVWCFAMKGVVGLVIFPTLVAWWWCTGRSRRGVVAVGVALVVTAVFALLYDAAYQARTGHSFFRAYLSIHTGYAAEKEQFHPLKKLVNVGFYAGNALLGFAPWSLALVWLVVRAAREKRKDLLDDVTRATLLTLAIYIAFLATFDRRSIRYIFSVYPVMAVCCAPLVLQLSARLRGWVEKLWRHSPEMLMGASMLVLWVRIYVHMNHYSYISTHALN
ncbi:MAG: glycosyltransferase family 39 protein [Myxococcota bacterium]